MYESEKDQPDSTSKKESPFLLIKGFLMGSADIVPGVSGGTMALILGIYTRLIHAIKSANLDFIKKLFRFKLDDAFRILHWRFLAVLISGILLAFLFFTKVVPLQVYMFTHPVLVFGLFFGLILGSIYILVKVIDPFGWKHGLFLVLGIGIGYWVVTLVPTETSNSSLFVFLSGSIAICAMILPGISGSYILLILRKYDFILSQIGALGGGNTPDAILILAVFIAGAIFGLVLFSRILSWLLDNWYSYTLAVLIGFLIGSLYIIWPYQEREYQEIITKKEVVDYSSPRAESLRESPPETDLPSFKRLGKIINADTTSGESSKVELLTVKKKLVHSEPFIPFVNDENPEGNFWYGIIGVGIGLILVTGIDYLRAKN